MEHFEVEVIKQAFCREYGHHRQQIGVFNSLARLKKECRLAPDELLNRCLYEVITRDKFEIKQGDVSLLSWTSEDVDGGTNRMIFNNLTGKNFSGTEYDVYVANMREKLNLEIEPNSLTIERTEAELPKLLDAAQIGWLDPLNEPFEVAPGILWQQGKRTLIFRIEMNDCHYIFNDWNNAGLLDQAKAIPENAIEVRNSIYLEMQKPIEQVPSRQECRTTVFDCWIVQQLHERGIV